MLVERETKRGFVPSCIIWGFTNYQHLIFLYLGLAENVVGG